MNDKIKYNPQDFETQMMELWEKEQVYTTNLQSPISKKQKAFCLSMFPYPSGTGLHVGHVRIYTGTDVLARYFRMQGKDVLHPMGWDAFGLPAENAAIKAKKNPMDMVPGNIVNFKRQMNMLGFSYDWTREISTTDPSYYKWTQWLFIQFFKMGLLYKKNTPIHFCPKCKTGLAEEEVLANETHERCGSVITKKVLPQWIFRITAYAERLLEDLKLLDWPKGILEMQKNWIGKKEGVIINHKVKDLTVSIETFSAYPAWLFADTFIVIAPEHPLVKKLVQHTKYEKDTFAFIEETKKITMQQKTEDTFEKKGIFTGRYALDPFNPGREMPIWIANFALMDFGTGIIRCSAHDIRDFEFATKYKIHLEEVVKRKYPIEPANAHDNLGVLLNSDEFTGRSIDEKLIEDIKNWIVKKGIGRKETTYHLRDWIFSRQRYWGEPIPMIFCPHCAEKGISVIANTSMSLRPSESEGKQSQKEIASSSTTPRDDNMMNGWFPLPEDQLPLELPYTKSYEPTDSGESPLSAIEGFVDVKCPVCGGEAQRETDTMPNWAGSCWYFIAFSFWNKEKANSKFEIKNLKLIENWKLQIKNSVPVDWYLGGAEHAVLHLLYARFWVKALQDLGLLNYPEPFLRLRNVGMVLAEDHRKMSKSWGNTINPDDIVAQFGADTLRMYEMFMAPFNMEIAWSTAALQGGHRFLKRVWSLYGKQRLEIGDRESDPELVDKLNKTIQKVGDDIAQTKFNTAIAALMEFLNAFESHPELSAEEAKKFIQIIAPFAPFITEKIWRDVFHEKTSVHLSTWPIQTKVAIKHTVVKLPIQIQGKFRGVLEVSPDALDEKNIEKLVLKDEGLSKYLVDKKYRLIYVKGRICNFVLS